MNARENRSSRKSLNKIAIVGCGPGHETYVTPAAVRAIERAGVLVGPKRLLDLFPSGRSERIALGSNIDEALDMVAEKRHTHEVAILVSGDPGIFSLAKRVVDRFGRDSCEIVPGVSSIQVAFARIGLAWTDAKIISAHKENPDARLWESTRDEDKIAILAGRATALQWIASAASGLGNDRHMFVCEDLTLETESIREVRAQDLADLDLSSRTIVLIIKKSVFE
ncbi:MAG: precorrin-6y C5,15-methyltransferase (decarboxylating) subunit CbiE [Deltaproteobacteria bacterium]